MPLADDIRADLVDVADGLETVTVAEPGASSGTSVAGALGRAVSTREAQASGGRYTTSDRAWHLPVSLLGARPSLGARIVDSAGTQWKILEVHRETLGTRWRCLARELAIAQNLDTLVRIERAAVGKGPGGAAQYTWTIWRQAVRARIQPLESRHEVENQARLDRRTHIVYLAEQIPVDPHDRIIGPDGSTYKVLGSRKRDLIDQLLEVDVLETRWPLG